jgi:3-oxoadipate enol-lactonase
MMFATVENTSLFYTEEGSEHKLPVIFLHGFPFSHEMWKEQLRLVGKKYRAISYDIRGHGKTDASDRQYSIDSHVDDLVGLMKHIKIDQAVIVGLSMGGYIALRAIEKHPEHFVGLVLCDTKSEADNNEAKTKRFQSIKDVKARSLDVFAEAYIKNIFAPESLKNKPDAVNMIRHTITSNEPLSIASNLLTLAARTDTTESLSKIKVPTLILVGEKDAVTTPANAQSMHEKIKDSKLTVIPDAAHMSNLENPPVFNEELMTFLNNITV